MKHNRLYIILLMLLAAALAAVFYTQPYKRTLTIGICADSYWEVPVGDSNALLEEAIAEFQAENPHVEIKFISGIQKADYHEWLAEKLLSGEEPDLFILTSQDFVTYAEMGAIRELNLFIEHDPELKLANYYPAAIDSCMRNDKYYALPIESVPMLMFVNKTLLANHNIPLPASDWTWQDFYAISRAVTADNTQNGKPATYGSYAYTWLQAAICNDVRLFSKDYKTAYFDSEEMRSTLEFMHRLYQLNGGYQVTAQDFDLGKVAFRPLSFAEYRTYQPYPWRVKKYSSFDWDVVTFPKGPYGKNISYMSTMRMGISSRSKNTELAWSFLKKLSYDKHTQLRILEKSQGLPSRNDILNTPEGTQLFLKSMDEENHHLTISAIHTIMMEARNEVDSQKFKGAILQADTDIKKIIDGSLTINSTLSQLQKSINAYLVK